MGKHIATCGHEIDIHQSEKGAIYVKEHDRQGRRAVSYRVVCPACLIWYRAEGLILDTTEDREKWLGIGNLALVGW